MSLCFRKKALLIVVIALSAAAFARPAQLLLHAGKSFVYPVQHPNKSSRGVWKLIMEVF